MCFGLGGTLRPSARGACTTMAVVEQRISWRATDWTMAATGAAGCTVQVVWHGKLLPPNPVEPDAL